MARGKPRIGGATAQFAQFQAQPASLDVQVNSPLGTLRTSPRYASILRPTTIMKSPHLLERHQLAPAIFAVDGYFQAKGLSLCEDTIIDAENAVYADA